MDLFSGGTCACIPQRWIFLSKYLVQGTCADLWLHLDIEEFGGHWTGAAVEGSSEPPRTFLHVSLPVWAWGTWQNSRGHAGLNDAVSLAGDVAIAWFSLLHYVQDCSVWG